MAASFALLGHSALKDPDALVVIVAWILNLLDQALVVAVHVTDLRFRRHSQPRVI
ncbi:hypothetical protein M1D34_22345 [Ensifer sp. D2-11]